MKKILLLLALYFVAFSVTGQIKKPRKIVYPSGPVYTVEQTVNVNFSNQFASLVTESGHTWNSFRPTNAQLGTSGNAVLSALNDDAGTVTGISITNTTSFNGASASEANYTESPPVYPAAAVNGAFLIGGLSTLRISGLTDGKYYQLYFLSASSNSGSEISINIGATTKTKVSYNNYPPTGSDRFTNTYLVTFNNVQSTGGVIDVSFNKIGAYYQSSINTMLFQRSNIAKP